MSNYYTVLGELAVADQVNIEANVKFVIFIFYFTQSKL